jgi:hypothetical protein
MQDMVADLAVDTDESKIKQLTADLPCASSDSILGVTAAPDWFGRHCR